jgi:hypothetical protein
MIEQMALDGQPWMHNQELEANSSNPSVVAV